MPQTLVEYAESEVLDISDHDQSGVHKYSSLAEDVQAFAAGLGLSISPIFTRLAVTPGQIVSLSLPTAPPKATDRRSFEGNVTTQVEAIPPDILVEIIREAITSRIGQATYEAVLAKENRVKAQFRRTLLPALRRIK